MRWQRTRYRQHVWGIGENNKGGEDLGMTTEVAASRWQDWWIGDHDRSISREIWARGLDDYDESIGRGRRRDDAPERTYLMAEEEMCLRSQGIDDSDGGIGIGRRSWGLSDDNRGVGGERGIDSASERSEKTADTMGARRRARGIYDNDGGVGRGIWERRLQQPQWRRRQRIDNAFKGLETTTEPAAAWQQDQWIGNNNGVLILLATVSLPVTLSRLCLVAVLFWYFFQQIYFFPVHCKKYYQYWNHAEKVFVPSVHEPCICTPYIQESKKTTNYHDQ